MKAACAIAVLLAVVAAALVGVRERSDVRRLQYAISDLERRRDALDRRLLQVETDIAEALSPRSLLVEEDLRRAQLVTEDGR
jgi:hypothetical protein